MSVPISPPSSSLPQSAHSLTFRVKEEDDVKDSRVGGHSHLHGFSNVSCDYTRKQAWPQFVCIVNETHACVTI